jgi:pimeloyl-ACP methyl ester carboxylesterase
MSRHTIATHLKLNLAADFHQPKGDGPFPLVILCHGFTGDKSEIHVITLADELAKAGIAALRFDSPGTGESEGTWEQDYRLSSYISIIPDVLEYAKAHLPIDPQRVGLWGHSMGGFTALRTAIEHPDLFVAVCASQPSRGRPGFKDEVVEEWRKTGWKRFSNENFPEINLPFEFYEDRTQYDAVKEMPGLKTPVLFLAGTADKLAPAAQVKAMFEAANEPKQYLEFDAPHDYKRHPALLEKYNSAAVEFFTKHLKS